MKIIDDTFDILYETLQQDLGQGNKFTKIKVNLLKAEKSKRAISAKGCNGKMAYTTFVELKEALGSVIKNYELLVKNTAQMFLDLGLSIEQLDNIAAKINNR